MRIRNGLVALCRIALALVFIFSGFVKAVDPWGTAIKLGEYFHAFGMDALSGGRYAFSILLSSAEMLLGFCLLFRFGFVRRRLPGLMLIVVGFFTLLTLVLALWNPVSDCGCFGDAVKLTNWQTFYKNLILLLLAVVVWFGSYRKKECWDWNPDVPEHDSGHLIEWSLGLLFLLFSLGVGLYSLRHLPLIDFLPFKAGVNLAVQGDKSGTDLVTTLIYKDKTTGQNHEFSLSDTTWYDSTRWEFVDTRFVERAEPSGGETDPALAEFSIFNAQGDRTAELLAQPQEWLLVTVTDPAELSGSCRDKLADAADYALARGVLMIGVTPVALADSVLSLGARHIPLYNIDGTTLKSLIRAHQGLVVIKEGTILAKWNCRDIPDLNGENAEQSILSLVAAHAVQVNISWLLGVCGVVLVLLYAVYFIHRRHV